MRRASNASRSVVARTPDEIGEALGLKPGEISLMKYKAELSALAVKAIQDSSLSVTEIVRKEMENALAPEVPLKVEITSGSNWADIH